jgi:hypothetical protein
MDNGVILVYIGWCMRIIAVTSHHQSSANSSIRDWQIEINGIHRLLGATGVNFDFKMLQMVAIFLFGICNNNGVIIYLN